MPEENSLIRNVDISGVPIVTIFTLSGMYKYDIQTDFVISLKEEN